MEVWWTGDKKWFAGTVVSISPDGDPVFGVDLPEPEGMRDGARQPG